MAEHNGGNRGNYGGGRGDRGSFRANNNSGGDPRGFRSRDNRENRDGGAGGQRDGRTFGDRDRKPFGERDGKKFGDRDRKPFGDRPRREGEERRSFGDRPARDGERRGFGDRDRGERKFGERKPFDRDRKPFGDRPRRDGEERRSFGDRDRGDRKFGDRPGRGPRNFDGPRDGRGTGPREDRPARVPNAADLRSANRPERDRSPEIDDDVTGQELDRATKNQIKTLESTNANWVAKHLVMAGRLMDIDPELSFQHALAASRRGGRLAVVREAVGLTAYAAGHYGEALREFRTYRRISGSNVHLPVMADCERGLGRPDRALDVVRSPEAQDLDAPGKVELAIVASGARADLGQVDAAVAELEIPQLDINRAFSYSPRLFRAYADALTAAGRGPEAERWLRQAVVAEDALGVGQFEEPDIIDLGEDDEDTVKPRFRRDEAAAAAAGDDAAAGDTGETAQQQFRGEEAPEVGDVEDGDVELDDAESSYFESDDAESDADSVEEDVLDESGDESAEGKQND